MANISEKILEALQQLIEDDFKNFKWFLKLKGHSGISAAQLEGADRQDAVDLMVQRHGRTGAVEEIILALGKISRKDLVESLGEFRGPGTGLR